MKKNRILICSMLFLILAIMGSIPTEISNKTEEAENPKTSSSPERLIFGTTVGPSDLDPHNAWDYDSFTVIDQVVETLFAYNLSDPELNITPRLATGLGTWSGGGLHYTVSLKQGVTFHDGLEFNAYAVRWNFERLAYFMNISQISTLYLWPDGTPIINSTIINNNYEVKFVLNRKFAPFEDLLCFSGSGIMSPLSTPSQDYINTTTGDLVGTGPFVYDEYIEDVEVNFHGYTNYWAGAPHIDELTFSIISGSTARTNALLAGDVDIIDSLDNALVQALINAPDITFVDAGQDATIRYLGMNNNLINVSFRKAISYALDYDYIINNLKGGNAVRAKSPVPLGIRYANTTFDVPILNLTHARLIMQSMEFGVGFNVTNDDDWVNQASTSPFAIFNYTYNIGNTFRGDMLVLLQNNLSKIGINVTDAGMEWRDYLDRLYESGGFTRDNLELYFIGWGPDYNDPSNFINTLLTNRSIASNGAQYNGYQAAIEDGRDPYALNDNVQLLMEAAISEYDSVTREGLYDRIQELLIERDYPWAWVYANKLYSAHHVNLTGFQPNALQKLWFYPVYFEQSIVVSPLSYNFGEVELGTSESTIITINNSGGVNLDIVDIRFKSGSCGDFAIPSITLPFYITPSGSIGVEVNYTPSQLGSCSAILEIVSSDPNYLLVEVQLTGRTQIVSNWVVNEVTLDGDPEEWADAIPYDISLYQSWGWANWPPFQQQSDKVLTVRFKNDGEWLYMFYEVSWSGPESPPEAAGISYHSFTGNPLTDSDSGWVGFGGGGLDYYNWTPVTGWLNDTDGSGQNDVEGMGVIDGAYYRFEFRKRLDSRDGLDWSLSPGETVGNSSLPVVPPSLHVQLWDADTQSIYQQIISVEVSQLVTTNYTLTSNIYFEEGDGLIIGADGITIDGNGYNITGGGSGSGILIIDHDSVTITNLTIQGFGTGISIQGGENNNITVNYISDNDAGIILSSTLNNVTNNIIARNTLGVNVTFSSNSIYRNLLINNDIQMYNVSGNIWVDPINLVGNFWSNYWGKDNGSDGRIDGDYIGDTDLPHEGVDNYPLLDPSIAEIYGPLPYADWWSIGRGGSPVSILAKDPDGQIISVDVNEIGLNAFYVENEDVGFGEDSIMILIAINPEEPVFGTYTYEITAEEDPIYDFEWFVSAVGDILFERSVENVTLEAGQTTQIGIIIQEAEDPAPGDPPVIVEPGDVIIQDIDAPTVNVTQPGSSEHIRGSSVYVEGTATDINDGVLNITVNGVEVAFFSTNNQDEVTFNTTVENLVYGENIVTIVVTNVNSNSTIVRRTVFRDDLHIISISGPMDPIALGINYEMIGIFIDPYDDETHNATWDWGDGTDPTEGTVDQANDNVTDYHYYEFPGVYTVTLTVNNSYGENDTAIWSQYLVIYDSSGGFVTGGGWIDSPEGAYPENPDLSGKANFGFIAKYKKGAKVPTGSTEFKFHAGDLNFHSDTYQWLIIAGERAKFKGSGTINGEGSYKFILTAVDGELVDEGGVDAFRIKIWEEDQDTGEEIIIYDNQLDTEIPEISGGSIVIHKKRK